MLLVTGGCSSSWLADAHMIVDGYDELNEDCRTGPCGHNENTDLVEFAGATYLVHRTAASQVLGPNSSLRVLRSDDHGGSWTLLAVIPAPPDRDIRDPHFYIVDGQLAIKALTRVPVSSPRDTGVDTITVSAISGDAGHTWSALAPIGPDGWSFWRIRESDGIYYSAAYADGDLAVKLFASPDGRTWSERATIYDVAVDTPSETELVFGADQSVTALVRVDGTDDELLGSMGRLRTEICVARPPYTSFACPRELADQRLDGPVAFVHDGRTFVIARKHFLEVANRKRTALFELAQDGIVEHGEFPSTGDTSYAGVVPIAGDRFLVSYYSSNLHLDGPWARAVFGPTDIWQATIDLGAL